MNIPETRRFPSTTEHLLGVLTNADGTMKKPVLERKMMEGQSLDEAIMSGGVMKNLLQKEKSFAE